MQEHGADRKRIVEGFIENVTLERSQINGLITARCDYNISLYRKCFFDALKIDFPEKLIGSVPKRQSEFLAGRFLAHMAFDLLNYSVTSLPIGDQGEPIWPQNLFGSISHAQGRCICFVGQGRRKHIGIDIEKVAQGESFKAIVDETLNDREKKIIYDLKFFPPEVLATLIFSAKESFFKACFPIVGAYFGFEAAVVSAIDSKGVITLMTTCDLHRDIPYGTAFKLQFKRKDEFVLTYCLFNQEAIMA